MRARRRRDTRFAAPFVWHVFSERPLSSRRSRRYRNAMSLRKRESEGKKMTMSVARM